MTDPVMDLHPGTAPLADSASRDRASLAARLLGLLLWLVVRPILRRISDLAFCRRQMARLDWTAPQRQGTPPRFGGVPVHRVLSTQARRVVLYLHGGGFFMHPTGAHLAMLRHLCEESGAAGMLPAYRLTPEHPFPQGLDDCSSAYLELLARGVPAASIVVAGESAGGTLTLALLMRLRDAGLPLPGCAVLISASTDLAGVGLHPSYHDNGARDAMVPPESLPQIVRAYAGDLDPALPQISPLHGSFAGLPPLHFVASRDEVLRDDSVLAADKARRAGVTAEIRLWPGLMHAFPLFRSLPEARAARADILRFIRAHCAESAALLDSMFDNEVIS